MALVSRFALGCFPFNQHLLLSKSVSFGLRAKHFTRHIQGDPHRKDILAVDERFTVRYSRKNTAGKRGDNRFTAPPLANWINDIISEICGMRNSSVLRKVPNASALYKRSVMLKDLQLWNCNCLFSTRWDAIHIYSYKTRSVKDMMSLNHNPNPPFVEGFRIMDEEAIENYLQRVKKWWGLEKRMR